MSGEVKAIEEVLVPSGNKVLSVVIAADQEDVYEESFSQKRRLIELSDEDLIKIIREAGIVGLGGAMFPTHVKLSVPENKEVDTVIINGAECEPYLTVDHRIMIEKSAEVVSGLKILLKATGASRGLIGIEANKPEAIKTVKELVAGESEIEVRVMETKYPQGGEKMLIKALLDREVPAGGLPLDVGVVVDNVSTALAVHNAVIEGKPLIERAITITGSGIKEPCNLIYLIGTPLKDLIEEAGGMVEKAVKVISGGPMMGLAQPELETPAIKGTSGFLIQTKADVIDYDPKPCIKCARCVDVCPVFLLPLELANASEHGDLNRLKDYKVMSCIECGSCSYICPAGRPLVHYIRVGKSELRAEQLKKKGEK